MNAIEWNPYSRDTAYAALLATRALYAMREERGNTAPLHRVAVEARNTTEHQRGAFSAPVASHLRHNLTIGNTP